MRQIRDWTCYFLGDASHIIYSIVARQLPSTTCKFYDQKFYFFTLAFIQTGLRNLNSCLAIALKLLRKAHRLCNCCHQLI
ncbi:unnamed protein product [Brugia timori]|uniref:Secreted protein n=1 Tax=Brugia timori TaxID=42155 RepID=A0A0R3QZJ8_9BILA|nr:unnamed protein product [Brugia timori]